MAYRNLNKNLIDYSDLNIVSNLEESMNATPHIHNATRNDIEFEINVTKLKSTLEKIPDRINFLKVIQ